jgi:hypothetical protein
LWFNALRTMMSFADVLQDAPMKKQCGEWSRKVKANLPTCSGTKRGLPV